MTKEILKKIKSRGYWQVNFYPKVFVKDKITTLSQCQQIVQKAVVELRGWDYPHYPNQNDEKQKIYNGPDYTEAYVDWECFKELWRIYQSGQYINFFGMREDWLKEDSWSNERQRAIEPGSILEIIHTTFRITEIYEFLNRLSKQGLYEEGVNVSISLFKTEGRKLAMLDSRRVPLHDSYIAYIPKIVFEKEYTKQEIIEKSNDIALDAIIYIYQLFNWNNLPIEVIKNDQARILERKF